MFATASSWSQIPTALLQAELTRRQDGALKPECGSGEKGHYNTPVHVFALLLVLGLSITGTRCPSTTLLSRDKGSGPQNADSIFVKHAASH